MPRFTVSVPFSLLVNVEAESSDSISDEMVEDALMAEYGKYAQVDIRHGGGFWDVIDTIEDEPKGGTTNE